MRKEDLSLPQQLGAAAVLTGFGMLCFGGMCVLLAGALCKGAWFVGLDWCERRAMHK